MNIIVNSNDPSLRWRMTGIVNIIQNYGHNYERKAGTAQVLRIETPHGCRKRCLAVCALSKTSGPSLRQVCATDAPWPRLLWMGIEAEEMTISEPAESQLSHFSYLYPDQG